MGVYTNNMRSAFISILLISFVSIAVFGIFGMHMGMQNHDGGCIASSVQGTDCPKQSDPISYLTFHIDAFKGFSNVVFGENFLASLLALVLLAVGVGLAFLFGNLVPPKLSPSYIYYRKCESFKSPPEQQFLRWLALHEKSPTTL